jgi:hypothetical protein
LIVGALVVFAGVTIATPSLSTMPSITATLNRVAAWLGIAAGRAQDGIVPVVFAAALIVGAALFGTVSWLVTISPMIRRLSRHPGPPPAPTLSPTPAPKPITEPISELPPHPEPVPEPEPFLEQEPLPEPVPEPIPDQFPEPNPAPVFVPVTAPAIESEPPTELLPRPLPEWIVVPTPTQAPTPVPFPARNWDTPGRTAGAARRSESHRAESRRRDRTSTNTPADAQHAVVSDLLSDIQSILSRAAEQ